MRLLLPADALASWPTATSDDATSSSSDSTRLPFALLLGAAAGGEARVAHVLPVSGVSAAEVTSSLPSGVDLLGCVVRQADATSSDETAAAAAAVAFLSQSGAASDRFFVATISSAAVPELVRCMLHTRSTTGQWSAAVCEGSVDASVCAGGDLADLPVFMASLQSSFHAAAPADLAVRVAALVSALRHSPQQFAWAAAERAGTAGPALRGRFIVDDSDGTESETLDLTAWSLLAEESPLVARKKAANKAAGGGGGKAASSSSATAAAACGPPLPIADYAIELSLLQRSTPAVTEDGLYTAPTLEYSKNTGGGPLRTLTLSLSVLHYASATDSLRSVLAALRAALVRQAESAQAKLRSELPALIKAAPQARALTLHALHFQPLPLPHALSVLFLHEALPACATVVADVASSPAGFPAPPAATEDGTEPPHPALLLSDAEAALKAQRSRLHDVWHLRRDTPAFRSVNALPFPSLAPLHASLGVRDPHDYIVQPRLFDVHTSIARSSGVAGGRAHLVSGRYAYYHYLQDKQSDSGWGCAYRTLQSICSWFVLQGYAMGRGVPSIRAIQQLLVDVDDKPARFVGSSEWIGSTEVGLVLGRAYGITTRTLFVTSGAEVASHARQLAAHFDTQGTPIMIGGGVLAYGLLGVDYCEASGECRFLILDPHYTGADSLAPILKGGWVGWKKADLFLADHFYNFAMPQRPADSI